MLSAGIKEVLKSNKKESLYQSFLVSEDVSHGSCIKFIVERRFKNSLGTLPSVYCISDQSLQNKISVDYRKKNQVRLRNDVVGERCTCITKRAFFVCALASETNGSKPLPVQIPTVLQSQESLLYAALYTPTYCEKKPLQRKKNATSAPRLHLD